jgi:hypothetical protein
MGHWTIFDFMFCLFCPWWVISRQTVPRPKSVFVCFGQPAQPIDATQALNLSAGVSNCKVSRGTLAILYTGVFIDITSPHRIFLIEPPIIFQPSVGKVQCGAMCSVVAK